MRTLIESILDADLDAHDEAVFTDQIIPKILKNIPYSAVKEMLIKIEGGKRVLFIKGKSSEVYINPEITPILENYNIYEVRSEGSLALYVGLTKFAVSAPRVIINCFEDDMAFVKCNITCDTLALNGLNSLRITCNQCQIKIKNYEIHRTPIEFINSKIIGLNSVYNFLGVISTRNILKHFGIKCSVFDVVSREDLSNEEMLSFDPLSKLAGIQKITKLPNVYVFATAATFKEYKPGLIFKSPRTPIDRQINKAVTISEEPIDCANGYEAFFMDTK